MLSPGSEAALSFGLHCHAVSWWLTLLEKNGNLEQKTQADLSPRMGRVNQHWVQLPAQAFEH